MVTGEENTPPFRMKLPVLIVLWVNRLRHLVQALLRVFIIQCHSELPASLVLLARQAVHLLLDNMVTLTKASVKYGPYRHCRQPDFFVPCEATMLFGLAEGFVDSFGFEGDEDEAARTKIFTNIELLYSCMLLHLQYADCGTDFPGFLLARHTMALFGVSPWIKPAQLSRVLPGTQSEKHNFGDKLARYNPSLAPNKHYVLALVEDDLVVTRPNTLECGDLSTITEEGEGDLSMVMELVEKARMESVINAIADEDEDSGSSPGENKDADEDLVFEPLAPTNFDGENTSILSDMGTIMVHSVGMQVVSKGHGRANGGKLPCLLTTIRPKGTIFKYNERLSRITLLLQELDSYPWCPDEPWPAFFESAFDPWTQGVLRLGGGMELPINCFTLLPLIVEACKTRAYFHTPADYHPYNNFGGLDNLFFLHPEKQNVLELGSGSASRFIVTGWNLLREYALINFRHLCLAAIWETPVINRCFGKCACYEALFRGNVWTKASVHNSLFFIVVNGRHCAIIFLGVNAFHQSNLGSAMPKSIDVFGAIFRRPNSVGLVPSSKILAFSLSSSCPTPSRNFYFRRSHAAPSLGCACGFLILMDVSFGGDSSFLGAPPAPDSSISVFNSRPTRSSMAKPTASGSGSRKRKRSEPDPESEDPMYCMEGGSTSNNVNDTSLPAPSTSPALPKRKTRCATAKEPPPRSVRSAVLSSSKASKANSTGALSKPKPLHVVQESRVPMPPLKECTPIASSSTAPIDADSEYDPSETFLGNIISTDPRKLLGGFIAFLVELSPRRGPKATDFESSGEVLLSFMELASAWESNRDLDYNFFPPPVNRSNHGLLQYFAGFVLQAAHRGQYLLRLLGDRETTTICFSRVRPILTSIDRFIKIYPVVEPYAFHHTSVDDPIYDDPSKLPLSPPSKNFVPQLGPSVAGITSPEELAKFQALAMEDFQRQFSAWSAAVLQENQEYQAALEPCAASRQVRFEASGKMQTMYADQVEEYNAEWHVVLLRNVGVVRSLGEFGVYAPPPPPFPNAVECVPNPDCSPTSISDLLDPAYRPPPPLQVPSIPVISRTASVAPSDNVAGLQDETANSQLGDEFDFGDGDDGEEDELEESPVPPPVKGKGRARRAPQTRSRSTRPYHHGEPMSKGGKHDREGNFVNTGGFRTSNEEGCEGMFEGLQEMQEAQLRLHVFAQGVHDDGEVPGLFLHTGGRIQFPGPENVK
ncbi:hypothetical protein DFH09DRAFT_1097824 [Mycena vulgaris]|nr:hypothetical protein DFH09DRAFT_1097824 [Mycena vulgaris]